MLKDDIDLAHLIPQVVIVAQQKRQLNTSFFTAADKLTEHLLQISTMNDEHHELQNLQCMLLAPQSDSINKCQTRMIKDLLFQFLANIKQALWVLFSTMKLLHWTTLQDVIVITFCSLFTTKKKPGTS